MQPSELGIKRINFSVVIPVYGNEGSIQRLVQVMTDLLTPLGVPAEVVFVIDGSPDRSLAMLEKHTVNVPFDVQLVEHSRNFGAFPAIRTGLSVARGDFVGVIAADLQEPPELLKAFFDVLSSGDADIVVGRREGRDDGASGWASSIYWRLYRRLVIPEIPPGGVDVFGVNRDALDELLRMSESATSLVGQLYWIGFRRKEVPYRRLARQEGKSSWTLKKKLGYLGDSIFAFTSLPIRLLTALGSIGILATVLFGAIVLGSWWMGLIPEPGYTPLMLTLLGCTSLLVMSLGIVGNYVWRTYENSKRRPASIVANTRIIESHDS